MSDSDISENLELKFIQEHLELASGNTLLCSNDSNLKNLLSYEKLHVFSDPTQTNSIHIDNLLAQCNRNHNFLKVKKYRIQLRILCDSLNNETTLKCCHSIRKGKEAQ